jgi:hypothetical protein
MQRAAAAAAVKRIPVVDHATSITAAAAAVKRVA